MAEEKRAGPRAMIKIEIIYKEAGSFVRSYILNLSNGGLFVKAENPLPLDTHVMIQLTLPGETEPMEIEGIIVWINFKARKSSFPKGMGVKFISLNEEDAVKIKALVKKHKKEIEEYSII